MKSHDADLNQKGLFLLISWELAEYTQGRKKIIYSLIFKLMNPTLTILLLFWRSDLEKNAYDKHLSKIQEEYPILYRVGMNSCTLSF